MDARIPAVSTAGQAICRIDPRYAAGGSFVGDNLLQAFDSGLGEGGDARRADAVDAAVSLRPRRAGWRRCRS
jgi:hypothetical protein